VTARERSIVQRILDALEDGDFDFAAELALILLEDGDDDLADAA
jgi:hypothetical protein